VITALLPVALASTESPMWVLIIGLAIFGVVFAVNSAIHSYLILAYSDADKVAMNVGFYYMANAGGDWLEPSYRAPCINRMALKAVCGQR